MACDEPESKRRRVQEKIEITIHRSTLREGSLTNAPFLSITVNNTLEFFDIFISAGVIKPDPTRDSNRVLGSDPTTTFNHYLNNKKLTTNAH
ncbi:hypothetical protein Glove_1g36 [Diversispora epigaea]|uniref:Uncharacterized protein n=1 Tax=Diversispora epigaea TaxID=1348612 RepID=A0A397JS86_9GLOM|nr:hypothetical protein Glove_1g36 [Diversispora epigaea]